MYYRVQMKHKMFVNKYGDIQNQSADMRGFLWIEPYEDDNQNRCIAWFRHTGRGHDVMLRYAHYKLISPHEIMIWNNYTEYIFNIRRNATASEFESVHSPILNKNGIPIHNR